MPIQPKQQPPYYKEGINIKEYTALITQTGTSNPTATVLHNTIGNIIWTRNIEGEYFGTLNNTFIQGKTIAPPFAGRGVEVIGIFSSVPLDYTYTIKTDNINYITLAVYDALGANAELSTAIGAVPLLITIKIYENV